jgi:hypothetical protein
MTQSAQQYFDAAFEKAPLVEYNKAWANNTGYLDNAVTANLELNPGQTVKAVDGHNRKIVIVGTLVGNVAVFQRYTDNNSTFVHNGPTSIDRLLDITGRITDEQMALLVGDGFLFKNIGYRLSTVFREALAPMVKEVNEIAVKVNSELNTTQV